MAVKGILYMKSMNWPKTSTKPLGSHSVRTEWRHLHVRNGGTTSSDLVDVIPLLLHCIVY
jgi:hypothetical protein